MRLNVRLIHPAMQSSDATYNRLDEVFHFTGCSFAARSIIRNWNSVTSSLSASRRWRFCAHCCRKSGNSSNPSAIGNALLASTLIAALAFGMAWAAQHIASGGVRLVSYLLQFYASAALIVLLRTTEQTEPSLLGAAASGLLAAICIGHYLWSRRTPPPPGGAWTDRINQGDRWAALLLIAALLSGFFTLRMGLYQGLSAMHLATPRAFGAGQSLLIKMAAGALLLVSLRRRNAELRNVGILIILVAAAKMFLDVVDLKGITLLISIFSFGVAAAIASLVLGRWGKVTPNETGVAES